ncbi:MAG: hypothetical protein VX127_14120 [Myxococcota bacterium]|nr:hypothetical protein [Myxococcota bacterium]
MKVVRAWWVALLVACQPTVGGPTVDSVSPGWGFNGEPTPILIHGANFFPGIDASGSAIVGYDRDFEVSLLGADGRKLSSVRQESIHTLAATVPSGIAAGWYALEVVSPSGLRSELQDAFEVTNTRADAIRLTVNQANVAVNEMVVLEVSLRSPDGQIVPEDVPIVVTAVTNGDQGLGVEFDRSGIENGIELEEGRELAGRLGASGTGFVGILSREPAEVWVTIEATIRDRVSVSATQLLTFAAGETDALVLEIPDAGVPVVAGDPLQVVARLVDVDGNTVSGTTATVALQETCSGGQFETTHTFVDDASIVVFPTKACVGNSIRAFGVVEGVAISGETAPFDVVAGPTAGVAVFARPERIVAGVEATEIQVIGLDEYGNSSADAIGYPTLALAGIEVGVANGNGEYECIEVGLSEHRCAVRILEADESHIIDVTTDRGLSGSSNPIEVVAGMGFDMILSMSDGDPVVGTPFPLWMAVVDEFGNRVDLTADDVDEVVFQDDFGPVDCAHTGTGLEESSHAFQCMFTVADPANHLYASSMSTGVVGSSEAFVVQPGPLQRVIVTRDGTTAEYTTGAAVALAFEGLDAFGNRVAGDIELTVDNVAGGLVSDEVVLSSGVGASTVLLTRPLVGDSIWAFQGPMVLGGTSAFDVRPGVGVGLAARAVRHWGFVGETLTLELDVVDGHGNPAPHDGGTVTVWSSAATEPAQIVEWLPGEAIEYTLDSARFDDVLHLELDGMTTRIESVDAGVYCPDFTASAELGASLEGRVCLSPDRRIAAVAVGAGVDGMAVQVNDGAVMRSMDGEVSVPVGEDTHGVARAFLMRDDGCAAQWSTDFWAGFPDEPVGPMGVAAADDTVTGGTELALSETEVTIEALTCTGDPATAANVNVLATGGEIVGAGSHSFSPTGLGNAVTLGSDGVGVVRFGASLDLFGGDVDVEVSAQHAYGIHTVTVLGDSVGPRVRSVSPIARTLSPVAEFVIEFTEPLLMHTMAVADDDWVVIESGGVPLEILHAEFVDEQTVVVEVAETIILDGSVTVTDEFRDRSGNRLDGDNDGIPGGTWTRPIGDVSDTAPAIVACGSSIPSFRPDGDDGAGLEADRVRIDATASDETDQLQWRVVSDAGRWVASRESDIGRSVSGSFDWDGRGDDGRVVSNGTYHVSVSALDEMSNTGSSCTVSVNVNNGWLGAGVD